MLCEKCKTNTATIHMTEIVNGSKKEVHLCEGCVEKDFILPYFKMSFSELFKSITSNELDSIAKHVNIPRRKRRQATVKKCWSCGSEFTNFDLFTDLGCANDYQIFSRQIDKLLRKYNNDISVHSGKLPLRSLEKTRKENRSTLLNMRIKNAIRSEDYELAAEIRDMLKNL